MKNKGLLDTLQTAEGLLVEFNREEDQLLKDILGTAAVDSLGFLANHAKEASENTTLKERYQKAVEGLTEVCGKLGHPNDLKEHSALKNIAAYHTIDIPPELT